jgi:hypothetical protein
VITSRKENKHTASTHACITKATGNERVREQGAKRRYPMATVINRDVGYGEGETTNSLQPQLATPSSAAQHRGERPAES